MSIATLSSAPTRLGPDSNGMLLTVDEYDAVQEWDDRYRYELIHGVLIVSPPASASERSPNDELGYLIRLYQDTHPQGSIVDETLPEQEISTSQNRRRADRAIWIGLGRQPLPERDIPAIVVELVSRRSRDRHRDYVEKRQEYAAVGVQEYWVFDRFDRSMTVYHGLQDFIIVKEGDVYRTLLLPGFELSIDRLLEKADRYTLDG
jgi:Uma2 family endonuclease